MTKTVYSIPLSLSIVYEYILFSLGMYARARSSTLWAGDEAVLGERVGELEVLPERGDEADDEDCPEHEADASKH